MTLLNYLYKKRIQFYLFFSSLFFLLAFQIKIPTNGDTYVYAISIEHFTGPIIHYGYYIIGSIFLNMVSFFGITPIDSLGYLSAFCGTLAILFSYKISLHLTKNTTTSIIAGILLLLSGSFWFFSIHGEVYIPQLTFIVLSIFLLLKQKPLISSLAFLVAVSITPTSVLAFPGLIYLLFLNRLSRKHKLYFILPPLIIVTVILVIDISKVIEILNWAIYSPAIFFKNINLISLIKKIVYDLAKVYIKSFNILLLIILYGFIKLFRDNKRVWILMNLFIIPFSAYIFNLGLISGDHLIISFFPIAFFGSYGITKINEKLNITKTSKTIILLVIVFIHGWSSFQFFVYPEKKYSHKYENILKDIDNLFEKDAILISTYNVGTGFWYLYQQETDYYLQTGRPNLFIKKLNENNDQKYIKLKKAFWINIPHFLDFFNSVDFYEIVRDRSIFFVGQSHQHSWIVKQILPESFIKNKKQKKTLYKRFINFLETKMNCSIQCTKVLDSHPFHIYKVCCNSQKNI